MSSMCAFIHCSFFLFCNTIVCFTLVFFISWFTFLPDEPKFSITNAFLTKFDFENTNNTLYYSLALNITIRNPNKNVEMYYTDIQVIAMYRKKRFSTVTLESTPIYQGQKNTTMLDHVVLEGQQLVVFGKQDLSQLKADSDAGIYSINVQLVLQVNVGYDTFKTMYYQHSAGKIDCKLKVPMISHGQTAKRFKATKCGNVYIISDLLPNHFEKSNLRLNEI